LEGEGVRFGRFCTSTNAIRSQYETERIGEVEAFPAALILYTRSRGVANDFVRSFNEERCKGSMGVSPVWLPSKQRHVRSPRESGEPEYKNHGRDARAPISLLLVDSVAIEYTLAQETLALWVVDGRID
jgi:hypothetical protein